MYKGDRVFMKAIHNYVKTKMYSYNIGVDNVVMSMLANIDDEYIYEKFWIIHKKYYDEAHKGGRGGIDNQLSTLKRYISYCKKLYNRSIRDEIYPLQLYNFFYNDKYLGLKQKKNLSDTGL